MPIQSINPYNEEVLMTYDELNDQEIEEKISLSHEKFIKWKFTKFEQRAELTIKLAQILRENSKEIGKLATLEMGKPLSQAKAEVEKCAWVCEFYAENAPKFLQELQIKTEAAKSYVRFDPLGPVLAVMPWNFPFWQTIRCSAPAIMAGNTVLLKHASNVPQCATRIEELYKEAGFEEGIFQTLLIGSSKVEKVLRDKRVKAASLTGSEYAGSQVGKIAGEEIKPVVLELGGSDPFIILEDADLEDTISNAVNARLQNNGQSCIAAKRFIVHEHIYDDFLAGFIKKFKEIKIGDPLDDQTEVGPVVNLSGINDLLDLIADAKSKGAKVECGGKRVGDKGFLLQPTIISGIDENMRIYSEETFGPVASVYKFKDTEDAIQIANDTDFGLGSSVWTKNITNAEDIAFQIDAGNVFINSIVRSHPALPFGGVKKSGVGRELGEFGIKEFVNAKTVCISK